MTEYVNESRPGVVLPEVTTIEAAPAFDEGGNFIDVRFGPLTLIDTDTGLPFGDYHLDAGSPAVGAATNGFVTGLIPELALDIDDDIRPQGAAPDIGADEQLPAVSPGGEIDTDADGVMDTQDNCVTVANADQYDSNSDGFGNACDTDLNNDGVTNSLDVGLIKSMFLTANGDGDFNGDGIVNSLDVGFLKSQFLQSPGPSGVAP
jgi:hypothetical protein